MSTLPRNLLAKTLCSLHSLLYIKKSVGSKKNPVMRLCVLELWPWHWGLPYSEGLWNASQIIAWSFPPQYVAPTAANYAQQWNILAATADGHSHSSLSNLSFFFFFCLHSLFVAADVHLDFYCVKIGQNLNSKFSKLMTQLRGVWSFTYLIRSLSSKIQHAWPK